jgi:hypothetical protein
LPLTSRIRQTSCLKGIQSPFHHMSNVLCVCVCVCVCGFMWQRSTLDKLNYHFSYPNCIYIWTEIG